MTTLEMNCSLTREEIGNLARQYVQQVPYGQNMGRENKALSAGQRISKGDYSLENLLAIVDWKSSRPKGYVSKNDPSDISDAL